MKIFNDRKSVDEIYEMRGNTFHKAKVAIDVQFEGKGLIRFLSATISKHEYHSSIRSATNEIGFAVGNRVMNTGYRF